MFSGTVFTSRVELLRSPATPDRTSAHFEPHICSPREARNMRQLESVERNRFFCSTAEGLGVTDLRAPWCRGPQVSGRVSVQYCRGDSSEDRVELRSSSTVVVQQRRVELQVPQLFAEWELGPVKSQHGHMRMTRKVQNTSVTAAIRWYLLVLIPPNPQTGQPNKLQL